MLPVAGLPNTSVVDRARAHAASLRRRVRGSMALSTAALAGGVALAQTFAMLAVHRVAPPAALVGAVALVLAALACLWIGTFGFVRLVTGRAGRAVAALTTAAFYGLALPFGTGDALRSALGLLPAALVASAWLGRLPWPAERERPRLPTP